MKTRALVKIYGGLILLGINLSYLLWTNYFLRMLDSSSRWNLMDYNGPMQSALEGQYLPEEAWPLHGVLLALGLFGVISLLGGIIEYIGTSFRKNKIHNREHLIKSETPKSKANKRFTWKTVILFIGVIGGMLLLCRILSIITWIFGWFRLSYLLDRSGFPVILAIGLAIYLFIKKFISNKRDKENAND